jgi:hypothetical protein
VREGGGGGGRERERESERESKETEYVAAEGSEDRKSRYKRALLGVKRHLVCKQKSPTECPRTSKYSLIGR